MTSLLIVDDNLRDHERYRGLLSACGVDLVLCEDGKHALSLLASAAAQIAGAIVLWELPGEPNGAELLTLMRRRQSEFPIIVVSGLLDLTRAVTARELGARDFLLKPPERDRLRSAVESILSTKKSSPLVDALGGRLIGQSPAFRKMQEDLASAIAAIDETILLIGENGTGKELLARAVHDLGSRDKRRWTPVNVASIPATLMESTLFGHEAGAFTDARSQRVGLFEESGQGTLFLDEIGELELALQAKLLRVIQERVFRRVGGSIDLPFQARLLCATNQDLASAQHRGRFRQDLYFRLANHEIHVPALRDRAGDRWLLIDCFLEKHARGRKIELAREARQLLEGYTFPGNVRELEGLIKDALGKCSNGEIGPYDLPIQVMKQRTAPREPAAAAECLEWPERVLMLTHKEALVEIEVSFDRVYLARKLREAGGNVTKAARAAGLDPKTFRTRWTRAGLEAL